MLEVFFRKFIKIILKINKSTPSAMVYGEVGKLRLQSKIDKYIIGYWLRLLAKNETTLAHIFYTMSLKLFMSGLYSTLWLQKVKTILDNCILPFMWHEQHTIDTSKTHNTKAH